MSAQKIHIGPNGPAPCRATVRACEYEISGTKEEVTRIWEKQQEALLEDSMLSGVSKSDLKAKPEPESLPTLSEDEHENPSKMQAVMALSSRDKYVPKARRVVYKDTDQDIAMKLALSNISELAYIPVYSDDPFWRNNGCSNVERHILKGGIAGYFKSFAKNSHMEGSFRDYGTTSLGAAINEINAYRMAQALGGEYAKMVPETVIREINGSVGTFQREVESSGDYADFEEYPDLRQDVRRAAIFDFIIGNQDRHEQNFLFTQSGRGKDSRLCIRLIDNSFSFPREYAPVNRTVFTDNNGGNILHSSETVFTEKDLDDLSKARATVEEWISSKTIDPTLGERTIKRIDYLADAKKICSFTDYTEETDWAQEPV